MIFYRHDPGNEYSGSSDKLCQRRADSHLQASIINKASEHACQRINIFPEYQRHFINQNIADHPSESPRNRPHHNSHPHREPESERLFDTHYAEQPQPDSIEYKERILQADHIFPEDDNEEQCQCRYDEIRGLLHPERSGIEEDITDRTTSYRRHYTNHISAEPVKLFSRSQANTTNRESECSGIVAKRNEVYHFDFFCKNKYFLAMLRFSIKTT